MKVSLVQLTSGDDPQENLSRTLALLDCAISSGAQFVLTPEVTNCVSSSRAHQDAVLKHPEDDITLAAIRAKARQAAVSVLIGSLAVKTDDPDGRFANRSFMIGPDGNIKSTYDKMHMFDVQVSDHESYHESKGYRPGGRAVITDVGGVKTGLTICYDLRFPYLFRALAQSGAQIITVPSAFSQVTGAAHWEPLLRARAIETGAFILAPAQTGDHGGRQTFGHSMIIDPWGRILADGGTQTGVTSVEINLEDVSKVRARIPAWSQNTSFEGPE
ncbi:carbon-nitrogen hydrolase family protein [Nereida sp. MMG025]|uniref:carbon-nitrogen hydrolase family protein n=1 Tax=Nereida sp. MMG025 TaxID=2909981 RepID=UPI00351CB86B|nr:carbon-nitrogen hydrolase family protein [Nereida sp. MMG025]